jgi:hypothetical protein
VPGLCRKGRVMTPCANELATRKKCDDDRGRRSWKKGCRQGQGTEVGSVAKHAKDSGWRGSLHAAAVTTGGERSWMSAAVSRSITFMGPPHLGQR